MNDTKKNLTLPLLHLNGTAKADLMEALSYATGAVHEAIDKVRLTAPHQRDYYPIPGTWARAQSQHTLRMERLLDVLIELNELAQGIDGLDDPRGSK